MLVREEELQPLVEAGLAPSSQSGAKPALRAGALVAGVAGVALLVCAAVLFHAPGGVPKADSAAGFLAAYQDGEIFQEGNQMFKHSCKTSSTYTLQGVLHNNFGGAGPDQGDEGIVIKASRHKPAWLCPDGDCFQEVKVELHAKSPYSFNNPHMNGMHGKFATITLNTGDSVEVQLLLKDFTTGEVLKVPFLPLSIYDIDANNDGSGREYIIAHTRHTTTLKSDAKVTHTMMGSSHAFEAQEGQGMAVNPSDPIHLTADQKTRSVAFNFIKPSEVRFKLGSRQGPAIRMFSFSLYNALSSCYDELLYDVTKPPTSMEAPTTTEAPTSTEAPTTTKAPATSTEEPATTKTTSTTTSLTTKAPVKAVPKKEKPFPWWIIALLIPLVIAVSFLLWYMYCREEEKPAPPPPPPPPPPAPAPAPAPPPAPAPAPVVAAPPPVVERSRLTFSFSGGNNEVTTQVVTHKPVGMTFHVGQFPMCIVNITEGSELHQGNIEPGMQLLRYRWGTQRGDEEWQEQPWEDVATSGNWDEAYKKVTDQIVQLPTREAAY